MATYRYEAADASGSIESGVLEADSARAARASLRARGLTPITAEMSGAPASGAAPRAGYFARRLSDNELALMTRQLASLLSARLTLDAALAALGEQAERPYQGEVLAALRSDVLAGHPFAEAIRQRPRDFPELYRALVAAGEESGDLGLVMQRLADYIEQRNTLRNKVVMAFTYPAIVATVAVLIVLFLLGYVVPQVVSVFAQTKQALPLLTRGMLGVSAFVRGWGWLVVVLAVAAGWGLRLWLRDAGARLAWDARVLALPLAGRFVLGLDTARFASTLSILVGAGVPLLRSLEAATGTMRNTVLRAAATEAAARVREGSPLARALGAQKAFPPVLVHMIASGEQTGEVSDMLERAAQTQSCSVA